MDTKLVTTPSLEHIHSAYQTLKPPQEDSRSRRRKRNRQCRLAVDQFIADQSPSTTPHKAAWRLLKRNNLMQTTDIDTSFVATNMSEIIKNAMTSQYEDFTALSGAFTKKDNSAKHNVILNSVFDEECHYFKNRLLQSIDKDMQSFVLEAAENEFLLMKSLAACTPLHVFKATLAFECWTKQDRQLLINITSQGDLQHLCGVVMPLLSKMVINFQKDLKDHPAIKETTRDTLSSTQNANKEAVEQVRDFLNLSAQSHYLIRFACECQLPIDNLLEQAISELLPSLLGPEKVRFDRCMHFFNTHQGMRDFQKNWTYKNLLLDREIELIYRTLFEKTAKKVEGRFKKYWSNVEWSIS